jgi:hypothetical protein
VSKNPTLIKGYIVNTGIKDITKEMVEVPLKMELTEDYRWLEVSAKSCFASDNGAVTTNHNTVTLSLGLFRRDEFFRFEGLLEVLKGDRWAGVLGFTHRIADYWHDQVGEAAGQTRAPLENRLCACGLWNSCWSRCCAKPCCSALSILSDR